MYVLGIVSGIRMIQKNCEKQEVQFFNIARAMWVDECVAPHPLLTPCTLVRCKLRDLSIRRPPAPKPLQHGRGEVDVAHERRAMRSSMASLLLATSWIPCATPVGLTVQYRESL